jgi:methylenetetrahydrofolate dehydrogenase (NADP+)/methenyltetrahydrofolate cyclohydrolase
MKLSGNQIALEIKEELKKLKVPSGDLAIVRIGDDPVTSVYVEKKLQFAKELGLSTRVIKAEAENIFEIIEELNQDDKVKGIIVQLPLPEGLDRTEISQKIAAEKDIDGFHYILGDPSARSVPPTVLAINAIFEKYNVDLASGVLIVGGGFLVGIPLKRFYEQKNIKAEILKKDQPDYEVKLKKADVLVIATGGGRRFLPSEFKEGSVVIDASTVSDEQKIRGDVSVEEELKIDLAPVPGGVGPITVAMLFKNFYLLNK